MSSKRDGSAGGGISPRARRAFGCVTWLYMGILTFLAVAFLLLLPFRYIGSGDVYRLLGGLSFFGLVLILPGMALAAALGYRTYRAPRRLATRVGAGVGAIVGWMSYAGIAWIGGAVPPAPATGPSGLEVDPVSYWVAQGPAFFLFPPLAVVATALVLYALFATQTGFERRRKLALAGAATAVVAGLAILISEADPLSVPGVVVSTIAAALAGWVSGTGYARAGGEDMIPPGAVKK